MQSKCILISAIISILVVGSICKAQTNTLTCYPTGITFDSVEIGTLVDTSFIALSTHSEYWIVHPTSTRLPMPPFYCDAPANVDFKYSYFKNTFRLLCYPEDTGRFFSGVGFEGSDVYRTGILLGINKVFFRQDRSYLIDGWAKRFDPGNYGWLERGDKRSRELTLTNSKYSADAITYSVSTTGPYFSVISSAEGMLEIGDSINIILSLDPKNWSGKIYDSLVILSNATGTPVRVVHQLSAELAGQVHIKLSEEQLAGIFPLPASKDVFIMRSRFQRSDQLSAVDVIGRRHPLTPIAHGEYTRLDVSELRVGCYTSVSSTIGVIGKFVIAR